MSLPAWNKWKEDGWTDWMLISDREEVPSNAGVYVIAAKHEISEQLV
ncbi:hypothetical protein JCM19238_3477 [Vibrio ponticus]|nr:hypothetical protein JCM19238_3477 [Vibrio ponticus]